jgi:hypothetical protein
MGEGPPYLFLVVPLCIFLFSVSLSHTGTRVLRCCCPLRPPAKTLSESPPPPLLPPCSQTREGATMTLCSDPPWTSIFATLTGCPFYRTGPHLNLVVDANDVGSIMVWEAMLLVLTGEAASHGCSGAMVLRRARASLRGEDSEAAGGRGIDASSGGGRCCNVVGEVLLQASGRDALNGKQRYYHWQRRCYSW